MGLMSIATLLLLRLRNMIEAGITIATHSSNPKMALMRFKGRVWKGEEGSIEPNVMVVSSGSIMMSW